MLYTNQLFLLIISKLFIMNEFIDQVKEDLNINQLQVDKTETTPETAFLTSFTENEQKGSECQNKHLEKRKNSISKVRQLNESAIDNICWQIQNSKLLIAKKAVIYDIKQKNIGCKSQDTNIQSIDLSMINKRRRQILKKKAEMLKQLTEIEKIEENISKSRIKMKQSSTFKLNISRFTAEDKHNILQIKLREKILNEKAEQRLKEYQQNISKYQVEQKTKYENRLFESMIKRKKNAQLNLEQIQKRHRQRQIENQKENIEILEIKKRKKLFEQFQKRRKQSQQKQKKDFQQKIVEMRKKRVISFDHIKSHQKEYEKIREQKSIERIKKMQQSKCEITAKKFEVKFLESALMQQKIKKVESIQKWNSMLRNIENNYIYCEKVRQQAKLKLKILPKVVVREKEVRPLDRQLVLKKGNQNMKQGNALKKNKQTIRNSESMHLPSIEDNRTEVDYLKMQRAKRKDEDESQKLSRLIDSDSQDQNNITKALKLTQKLQKRANSTSNLVRSAQIKLKILQRLQKL